MDHADGGFIVLVLQIGVEAAQLPHQEHAFIYNGPAGQAGHIGTAAGLLEHSADHIEPAVEVDALGHLGGLFDKALPDGGHAVPGGAAQDIGVHRDFAPGQESQPFLPGDQLKELHSPGPQVLILGEEEHAHTVFPLAADGDIQLLGHLGEKLVADLEQDAHAVAGLALGILAGPMFQPLHNGQRVADGLVALAALDVHHRADAAGVVLKAGVVQADCLLLVHHTIHSPIPSFLVRPRWPHSWPGRGPKDHLHRSRARHGSASRTLQWCAPDRSNISQTAPGRASSLW